MTGVLLVSMGGPESPDELKKFLRLMFLDKHIIPAPYLVRNLLSQYISRTRYKNSWERYSSIGGSPMRRSTEALTLSLKAAIGSDYDVRLAYSYSHPLISETISSFIENRIFKIIAIPLYPHSSIGTTNSVISDLSSSHKKFSELIIRIIPEFYENPLFVNFWANSVMEHISEMKLKGPLLLFSAHSVPLSYINKGDTYRDSIEESASIIAKAIGLEYAVAYQSGMNPKKWLGPDTLTMLREIAGHGRQEVVIVPISFVSENLETLYDLDRQIVPLSSKELNINISRVKIPENDPVFIEMLKELIDDFNY